jgi:hypothetical protein
VRLVSPNQYGFVNTKHLCRIELHTAEPTQSYGSASATARVGLRLLGYTRFSRARGLGGGASSVSPRLGAAARLAGPHPADRVAQRSRKPLAWYPTLTSGDRLTIETILAVMELER